MNLGSVIGVTGSVLPFLFAFLSLPQSLSQRREEKVTEFGEVVGVATRSYDLSGYCTLFP